MLVNKGCINRSNVPILVRFALDSMKRTTVLNAFKETGVYPFDRSVIDDSLLVGDAPIQESSNTVTTDTSTNSLHHYSQVRNNALCMDVYDENDNPVPESIEHRRSVGVQTQPVENAPCSVCIFNDASSCTSCSDSRLSTSRACFSVYKWYRFNPEKSHTWCT